MAYLQGCLFEKVLKTETLLVYLFGGKADFQRSCYNDWRQNLVRLDRKADPISRTRTGRTPLSWAAEKGHKDIVGYYSTLPVLSQTMLDLFALFSWSWLLARSSPIWNRQHRLINSLKTITSQKTGLAWCFISLRRSSCRILSPWILSAACRPAC